MTFFITNPPQKVPNKIKKHILLFICFNNKNCGIHQKETFKYYRKEGRETIVGAPQLLFLSIPPQTKTLLSKIP